MIEGWTTKDAMGFAYVVGLMSASVKAEDVADADLFRHGMAVCMKLLKEITAEWSAKNDL